MLRGFTAGLLLVGVGTAAMAADITPPLLPTLALASPPEDSIWHGAWVSTSIVGVAGRGTKGFVGGDVSAGYDRVLTNGALLGIATATGVAPGYGGFGPVRAFDFATLGAKLAYPLGRWMPYLTTGLLLAKPNDHLGSRFDAFDSTNALFNGPEKLDVGARIGAGFDYALTSTTSVGLGVSVNRGAASVFP